MNSLDFFKIDSNTSQLDGRNCSSCRGEIPLIKQRSKRGNLKINRNNRVDCESPRGHLMTYHIKCWYKEVYK